MTEGRAVDQLCSTLGVDGASASSGSGPCLMCHLGVNPKGAGRKGALLLDVYGD